MVISHTNRKGRTYYLCQGVGKTGKTRYFFAREPQGDPVGEIPEGYEISESVNGVVSLVKSRPPLLLETEILAVKNALENHPRARLYRMDVKGPQITIHEHAGSDPREVIQRIARPLSFLEGCAARFEEEMLARGQFAPVMRFTLTDEQRRHFRAERMCYLGSMEGWIGVRFGRPIEELARRLIPRLGTDEFFELH